MPSLSRLILPYPGDSRTLFSRVRHLPGSFLLLSSPGFKDARFDVFSALPAQEMKLPYSSGHAAEAMADILAGMVETLRMHQTDHAIDAPLPGWYGLASYDLHGALNGMALPAASLQLDLLLAGFYPSVVVIDHQERQCSLLSLTGYEQHAETLLDSLLHEMLESQTNRFQLQTAFGSNLQWPDYSRRFDRVQEYLHAGDCYQVNLAQRFSAAFQGDSWTAFEALANRIAAPMASYFQADDFQCLSLSPERFLSVRDGLIATYPIKGTRPRHADPVQDQANARELQASEKDRAENLMIVDLLRNDLGRCCQPGSIQVTELFGVESYVNVHHLVSTITGQLRPDVHPLAAFFSAFPGGSITGAPKRRAMEIIAELEPDNRSFYCGCAFYCDVGGRLDSSILIRSLIARDGAIHCWGGGGIVADSEGEKEYQETLDKVGIILRTLEEICS